MANLKTEHLSYVYSAGTPFEKKAVDDVSIEIKEGEIIGVIGHTGSGKSTLIQHLNGLLKPTSGKILLDGKDIWEKNYPIRQARFEDTVYKDIAFGAKNMGLDEKETDKRVRETAEEVGLSENLLKKSPFELSGGQKRRVAIAGVMAMRPEILILDEPTAGLDPKGRDNILELIKTYHRTKNATVLIVSHSMEDMAKYAERILVMNRSKMFCFDKTENVFARSEEIEKIGLSVPQITRVFRTLRQKNINIEDVYTVEQAENAIRKYLEAKGRSIC